VKRDVISFGNESVKAIYTPGHTDDSYSFVYEAAQELWLFTGDALLIRGSGRTDFQNGNAPVPANLACGNRGI
jgi:sulfur dioxygenase